jgi:uncharacterized membrane protein YjfL (UPF0719 family)
MTETNFTYLLDAVLHAGLGIAIFAFAIWIFQRGFGVSWREQVLDRQNTAAALLLGLIAVALGIIVAASVH